MPTTISQKEKERESTVDKMLLMMELYYTKELDVEIQKLYHKIWAEYSVKEIASACKEYMSKGKNKYFPKAGEIIDIIQSTRSPQGSLESTAQNQWRIVMAAVRQRGEGKGAPFFDDPITKTLVMHQFSWQYLCNVQVDKLNWEEKRFNAAYNLAAEVQPGALMIDAPKNLKQLTEGIGIIGNISDANKE